MQLENKNKTSLRPALPNVDSSDSLTPEERFQNETLRPILKLQHLLIELVVHGYFETKKGAFYKLNTDQKPDYIKKNLLSDKMIVHELRGIVIGLFTLEETKFYLKNRTTTNKRIQSLLFQRIMSFV